MRPCFLHLTLDIFKHHDKSKFEVYAFYSGLKEDKWTKKAKGYFDKFFNVSNLNGEEIANLSRKNQIDIAINCSGHTGYNQNEAFNCRVSSIQVNYLGYPGTMGDECHDYIIADKFVLPKEEASNYTEKILYLLIAIRQIDPKYLLPIPPCQKKILDCLRFFCIRLF